MPVETYSTEGLTPLIHGLDELGLTTSRPTWTLQQNDASWFGLGDRALVKALDEAPTDACP
ncbi:hypothetical protein [Streptomyces chattanoogensis]|uniref:hypothetical protein n=1 Tax=Streptomyces chattanoogensis TaxID=66876 RepID=UPI0036C5B60D